MEDLALRKLDLEGLKTLVGWAKNEGWNPGPYDADVFWTSDPDGFYGYFLENTLIAGGAVVSSNGEFGFMGLFIVSPEYRANGIGRKLWYQRRNLLIDRLKDNASIGMDGVVAMQDFYKKGGFEIAFKDERYVKTGEPFNIDSNISIITKEDFPEIHHYDTECFGFARPQFLSPWISIPDNKTFKYTEENTLRGFAIVRKASIGYKVGPLFADSPEIAEELYKACLNAVIGEPLYLDIPMNNQGAIAIVQKHKAEYVFECARMFYGQAPQTNTNKIYGITTFELG